VSVYTRRFSASLVNPGALISVVVPTGKVWIITNVLAVGTGSSSATILAVFAPMPVTIVETVQAPNTTVVYDLNTRVVVNAAETIGIETFVGSWYCTVTGYEFSI
jgi:hypothetical protein